MPERVVEAVPVMCPQQENAADPASAAGGDDAGAILIEAPRADAGQGSDWVAAGVVFAILGGCCAMFLTDLSPIVGTLAAGLSGVIGILFGGAE